MTITDCIQLFVNVNCRYLLRFRSAKEAEVLEAKAKQKGEKLPTDDRFDSNCITPGTEFMVRLQEALRYFVKVKISTSPLWKNCRVILSGHEVSILKDAF